MIISLLMLVTAFVVLCIVSIFIAFGLQEINTSPLYVSNILPFDINPRTYDLSVDQKAIIGQNGYPDSFTILFYDDEFGGTSTRLETWVYSREGMQFTFTNGKLEGSDSFVALQGRVIFSPYKPQQFSAYMSLEEVLASTKINEFLLLPLEKELVLGGESYFSDRLAFGLKDGELMYVEAIGFEYLEDEAVVETDSVPQEESTQPIPAISPTPEVIKSTNPQIDDQGDPFVYVSSRDDPNWPDCEDSETGCRTDIFIHYPDSTGFIDFSLTASADFEFVTTPAISHDGSQVAFGGSLNGKINLYVVNTDASSFERITSGPSDDWMPAWSPNDDQIAFVSNQDGENSQNIFIIDLATLQIEQITTGEFLDRFVDWSPSGKDLAFNSNRSDPNSGTCYPDCEWNLYMLQLSTGTILPLPDEIGKDAAGITWSPDGKMMAFHAKRGEQYDLFLLDMDFNLIQLSNTPNSNETHPAWSPDGKRLAFSSDENGNWDIAITPITHFDPYFYTGVIAPDHTPDW